MEGCDIKFDERTKRYLALIDGFLVATCKNKAGLPGKIRAAFRGPLANSVRVIRPYRSTTVEEGVACVPFGVNGEWEKVNVQWPGRRERTYLGHLIADTPENRDRIKRSQALEAEASKLRDQAWALRRECTKPEVPQNVLELAKEGTA